MILECRETKLKKQCIVEEERTQYAQDGSLPKDVCWCILEMKRLEEELSFLMHKY